MSLIISDVDYEIGVWKIKYATELAPPPSNSLQERAAYEEQKKQLKLQQFDQHQDQHQFTHEDQEQMLSL